MPALALPAHLLAVGQAAGEVEETLARSRGHRITARLKQTFPLYFHLTGLDWLFITIGWFTSDRDLSSILLEIPSSRLREKELVMVRSVVRVITVLNILLARSVIIVVTAIAAQPELRLGCCDRETDRVERQVNVLLEILF